MRNAAWTLIGRPLRRLFGCRAGNVAIVFALALPLVVGGAGLGAETTYWRYEQLQLQGAADAAAYAGAVSKRGGGALSEIEDTAEAAAAENGYAGVAGSSIAVAAPPVGGPANAVDVVIQAPASRFFTALFSHQAVMLRASARANYTTASSACVLALHNSASKALLFSGSSNLTLQGCSVMANSVASDALTAQGSGALTAPCAYSGGGASVTSNVHLDCTSVVTGAPRAGDPFKDVPQPASTSPCRNDNGATLQPGTYCSGMNLKNNVTLNPGVYVVEGGDFNINANANVTGDGVTIFLKGSARVNKINGTATVDLTAPSTGPYAGILFFGDRSSSGGQDNVFNGTATSHLTGAIYFATQSISYQGNFSGLNGCVQVVGLTVQWTGNATMGVNCSAYGMNQIPAYTAVRLVG